MQVPKDILADPAAELVLSLTAKDLTLDCARRLADLPAAKVSARALMGQAQKAEAAGDKAGAKRHWLAVAEAAGERDATALNNAAWFLCTTDAALREPQKAEELARRALAQSDRTFIRDTLAEALLVNGKLDEARRENDAVLRQDPDSEEAKKRAERIGEAAAR